MLLVIAPKLSPTFNHLLGLMVKPALMLCQRLSLAFGSCPVWAWISCNSIFYCYRRHQYNEFCVTVVLIECEYTPVFYRCRFPFRCRFAALRLKRPRFLPGRFVAGCWVYCCEAAPGLASIGLGLCRPYWLKGVTDVQKQSCFDL